jgi:hypothetical protein
MSGVWMRKWHHSRAPRIARLSSNEPDAAWATRSPPIEAWIGSENAGTVSASRGMKIGSEAVSGPSYEGDP